MSLPPQIGPEDAPPAEDLVPAPPPPAVRRLPNLAHALLFVAIACAFLFFNELVLVLVSGSPVTVHDGVTTVLHPKLQVAVEAVAYLVTVLIAWLLFPTLWRRPFLEGIRWHWFAARTQAGRLIPLGLLLATMSAAVDYFVPQAKPAPIDQLFATAADAWLMTFFGIIVAPAFEELCFRGFLLPAFAIAYDWLSLPRTSEARTQWQTTTTLSPMALLFSAILTSILFAALHGQQVAYARTAMLVLFSVSLVLSWVRIKTNSVAASTLVHSSYNFLIFLVAILQTSGYRHLDRMTP